MRVAAAPVPPAEQEPNGGLGHSKAAPGRKNRPEERYAGRPMLAAGQNVMHNDSRGAGLPRGTTKPL